MRMLYSAPEIDLSGGHGGSTHVLEFSNFLAKKLELFLICNGGSKDIDRKVNFFLTKKTLEKHLSLVLSNIFLTVFISLKYRPEIYWERSSIFTGFSIIIGKLLGKKTVYELNEPPLLGLKYSKNPFYKILYKILKTWQLFIIKITSFIVTTSETTVKDFRVNKEKLIVVDWGINLSSFKENKKETLKIRKKYGLKIGKTVIYVGSFREWQACESIVLAAKEISKTDKEVGFLMVGSGDELKKCQDLASKINLRNIFFTGRKSFKKVINYLYVSDIGLALFDPKYRAFQEYDYFFSPMKVHEYKACGNAIIASKMGNLKKLVKDNVNGKVIDNLSAKNIASAIEELIKNKEMLSRMKTINKKESANFSWDKTNKKIFHRLFDENVRFKSV